MKSLNLLKNKYIITASLFVVWMSFFDQNDLGSWIKRTKEINKLEADREYYTSRVEELKQRQQALFNDDEELERFAREKYLMRKDGEDLYIVQEVED